MVSAAAAAAEKAAEKASAANLSESLGVICLPSPPMCLPNGFFPLRAPPCCLSTHLKAASHPKFMSQCGWDAAKCCATSESAAADDDAGAVTPGPLRRKRNTCHLPRVTDACLYAERLTNRATDDCRCQLSLISPSLSSLSLGRAMWARPSTL